MGARAYKDRSDAPGRKVSARHEASAPSLATGDEHPVLSPAQALQMALAAEFEPQEAKWPPVARLAFLVGACGSLWAAIFLVVLS